MSLGRNDPCPCGSGKKYKKCCMNLQVAGSMQRIYSTAHSSAEQDKEALTESEEVKRLIGLFNLRRFAEVEARSRLLIAGYPYSGFAWKLLGASLQAQGKDALVALQRIVALFPNDIQVWGNLWLVLRERGLLQEAETSYRHALLVNPNFAEAHANLGNVLCERGEIEASVNCFQRALTIKPTYAQAHNNLGKVLRDLGRLDEAVASCQHALLIEPNFAEAHNNLGNALSDMGQLKAAEVSYRKALALGPTFADFHCNLGSVLSHLGQLDEALGSYRQALAINPDFAQAYSGFLFCLSHSEAVSPQSMFTEHCRFAQRFEAPFVKTWPQHANARDPDRVLRLGFVSGDFRNHAVAHFIAPVLAQLSQHPDFSLHAYYTHTVEDEITRRLQAYFTHWHAVAILTDAELAEKIIKDGIDILVDLSGHTAHNRLLTFARKPAPIQISWIGYPNTTGLRAIDYVLGDPFNSPLGLHEPYYVEKFARMPTAGTFVPQFEAPDVNALPALSNKHITFGSFNRPDKLQPQVISTWAKVMLAVPNSVMMLGNVSDASQAQRLKDQFAQHGVAAERLRFQPRVPLSDYLELHHRVDIILDTWPYTGGTTTNFALWMGVPVVTLTGPLRAHCTSAAVIGRCGVDGWIAQDVAQFVQIAVHWANSLNELAILRTGLRERMRDAPLRQPETVTKGMAQAFRMMWLRWCAGLPAEHFEVDAKGVTNA